MSLAANSLRTVARPPAKGSFPLDRDHQCSSEQQQYLQCLTHQQQQQQQQQQQHQQEFEVYDHLPCRGLAKAFLECRMHFNLMQKEDLSRLGFADSSSPSAAAAAAAREERPARQAAAAAAAAEAEDLPARSKEDIGFIAGIQSIQPYTTRGFFGRIAARFSWPKDFLQRRSSSSSSNSLLQSTALTAVDSSSNSSDSSSSSMDSSRSDSSSSSGRTSQGFHRPDERALKPASAAAAAAASVAPAAAAAICYSKKQQQQQQLQQPSLQGCCCCCCCYLLSEGAAAAAAAAAVAAAFSTAAAAAVYADRTAEVALDCEAAILAAARVTAAPGVTERKAAKRHLSRDRDSSSSSSSSTRSSNPAAREIAGCLLREPSNAWGPPQYPLGGPLTQGAPPPSKPRATAATTPAKWICCLLRQKMPSLHPPPPLEGPVTRLRLDVAKQHLPPLAFELLSLGRETSRADSAAAANAAAAAATVAAAATTATAAADNEAAFTVGAFVRRVSGEGPEALGQRLQQLEAAIAALDGQIRSELSGHLSSLLPGVVFFGELLGPDGNSKSGGPEGRQSSNTGSEARLRSSSSNNSSSSSSNTGSSNTGSSRSSSSSVGEEDNEKTSCNVEELQQQIHRISQHAQQLQQLTQKKAEQLETSVDQADRLLDAEEILIGALHFLRGLRRVHEEPTNYEKAELIRELELLAAARDEADSSSSSGSNSSSSNSSSSNSSSSSSSNRVLSFRNLKCMQPALETMQQISKDLRTKSKQLLQDSLQQQDGLGVADALKCLFSLQQQQRTLESLMQQLAAGACKPMPIEALRGAAAAAAAGSPAAAAAAQATPATAAPTGGEQLVCLLISSPFQQHLAAWLTSLLLAVEEKLRQAFLLDQQLQQQQQQQQPDQQHLAHLRAAARQLQQHQHAEEAAAWCLVDSAPLLLVLLRAFFYRWMRAQAAGAPLPVFCQLPHQPAAAANAAAANVQETQLLGSVGELLAVYGQRVASMHEETLQLLFSPELLQQAQQEQQQQTCSSMLQRMRSNSSSSNGLFPTAGDVRAFLRQLLQHVAAAQTAGEPLLQQVLATCEQSLGLFAWLCILQIPAAAADAPSLLDETPQHRAAAAARLCTAKSYSLFALLLQRTKQAAQKETASPEGTAAAALLKLKTFRELDNFNVLLLQRCFIGPPLLQIYQQVFAVLPIEVQQLQQQQQQQRREDLRCMRVFERAVLRLKQQYLSLLPPALSDIVGRGACLHLLQGAVAAVCLSAAFQDSQRASLACCLADTEGCLSVAYPQLHVHLKSHSELLGKVRRLLSLSTPHLLAEYEILQQQQQEQQEQQQQQQQQLVCVSVPLLLAAIHVLQRLQRSSSKGLQQLIGASDDQLLLSAAAYLKAMPENKQETGSAGVGPLLETGAAPVPFSAVVAAATTAFRVGCTYTLEQQLQQQQQQPQQLSERQQLLSALGLLQQDAEKDGY
ncbi:hypothetical protein Efla_001566 [Eimeria flavescens]